ncbi:MAG: DNA mismatch repair endonuclease MutL [Lachnospiraceae bacterium]|nr:DNA mismatch repair endonuclease MutL [Lachnospiraceae bacterium]
MAEIQVLDSRTIDQIAAGEVVERPASVVKELVENACDAQATAITVEIKDGGTTFIRVTDNGSGIEKEQVKKAFFRHATSKIRNVEDLSHISSMGFRGEALSSISAVAMVEMITKTKDSLTGVRYSIEGEREQDFSEVGAPEGTTIIVRDLFFNTPARKKFLKTPATEGSYIADLMEHMALARPDISFQFMINRQTRFSTSGSGDLKEVVYRIYGREIAKEIFPFKAQEDGIKIEGFLGTPILVRPNRNFEFFFVNQRYIKSQILSKGLESGYQSRLMQHKFPMAYLHLSIDTESVDVNVHPSKMEVRFSDNQKVFDFLERHVKEALASREMIPTVSLTDEKDSAMALAKKLVENPPKAAVVSAPAVPPSTPYHMNKPAHAAAVRERPVIPAVSRPDDTAPTAQEKTVSAPKMLQVLPPQPFEKKRLEAMVEEKKQEYENQTQKIKEEKQLNLFEEKILTQKAVAQYNIIGQIFDTYWIASYQDKMILIDQHAAHEKVKYEALVKKMRDGTVESQNLLPPLVITLTAQEEGVLKRYEEYFSQIGFEIEPFGGNSYALRSVPCDLYGNLPDQLLQEILNELSQEQRPGTPAAVTEKIATMACKSAVKGNHKMSREEMESLLSQLLTLDNPYHCPHGRPTMITMSKQELERKFKRIV